MSVMTRAEFAEYMDELHQAWDPRALEDVVARRSDVAERLAQLESYEHLSGPQQDELERLGAEKIGLDEVIGAKQTEIRRAKLERVKAAAQDPRNLEAGSDQHGAPALIHGRGTRLETAAETVQRSNPWGSPDTSGSGYVSRAHDALTALEERLGHDGCEMLAQALSERLSLPGVTVKRSRDETADAAALILSLSNPYYESAMRSVFRSPETFSAGLGHMLWSDEERQAMYDVMSNQLVRSAFAETAGNLGAFALPLQLDPTVILTNSGVVGPFRQLARTVIGTSNVWEGISSAGVQSGWVAEAGVVGDSTPTLSQISIQPYKQASWAFGSFEVLDDTELSSQLPGLFADGKTRLENTAFAIGTGSAQPFGIVTAAAADATAGALTNTMIYALHGNLPPRFRVGDGARPAWLSNVSILNAARQLIPGTGMTTSIVDDSATPPRMLGLPFYEASAMASGTTGNRELLLADFSQFIVVDRLPSIVLAEPLVKDATTQRPTGQRGWLQYSRTGSDLTTRGAAYGSSAAVVHVH